MTYLASLALSWFLVSFEPLQLVWDGIASKIKPNHLVNYIHAGLGCDESDCEFLTLAS